MSSKKGFKVFLNDLKNDSIKGVIAFFGDEKFLIDWAIKEVVKKYINPATYELDFEKINLEDTEFSHIEASYLTSPFFSEKRVVVIENYKDKYLKEVVAISKNNEENILVLLCSSKESKIIKELNSYEFPPLTRPELVSFVEKRFKNNNLVIPRAISSKIAEESGYLNKDTDYDLYNLEGDLIKIVAYADSYGDEITMDIIREILSDTLDNNIFKLIDAVGARRKDKAYDHLRDLISLGVQPINILSTIINNCEAMLQVKELLDNGISKDKIEALTKIRGFRIEKLLGVTRNYHRDNIRDMLINAYSTDALIKKGLIQPNFALELLIGKM